MSFFSSNDKDSINDNFDPLLITVIVLLYTSVNVHIENYMELELSILVYSKRITAMSQNYNLWNPFH